MSKVIAPVVFCLMLSACGTTGPVPSEMEPPAYDASAGMDRMTFSDGGSTGFEVGGSGPGIIFISRSYEEHAEMAQRLRQWYTVARYVPRWLGGKDSPRPHDAERESAWTAVNPKAAIYPFNLDRWPYEVPLRDLLEVADKAGLEKFVLGGYSGTAITANSMAGQSDRIHGVIIGGMSVVDGYDYHLGHANGLRDFAVAMEHEAAAMQHFRGLEFEHLIARDHVATYKKVNGPKIVWFGSQDGAPGSLMAAGMPGARIAQRLQRNRALLESLGFTYVVIQGAGHLETFADLNGEQTALLREALVAQGWK